MDTHQNHGFAKMDRTTPSDSSDTLVSNPYFTTDMEVIEELHSIELNDLDDSEYLDISRSFGEEYMGLLNGHVVTEFQKQVSEKISIEMQPIVEKVEALSDQDIARYIVQGYRTSLNALYESLNSKPPFSEEVIDDEALTHVKRVARGPYSIPVLYTDGFNEELFGDGTLSFASTDLMLDRGLPPAVIVYEGYSDVEKDKVTAHETSHALFTILRRTGIIPNPEGEGAPIAGKKSAFELARDEAIAQLAANQNSTGHPSVIQRMKKEGYDDQSFDEYHNANAAFDKAVGDRAGLNFRDAILGVMMAKNFKELSVHMLRMGRIAGERQLALGKGDVTSLSIEPSNEDGWALV